ELDEELDFDVVHHATWASLHVGSHLWKIGKPFVFGPVGGGQVAPPGFSRYFRAGRAVELLRSVMVRHLTGMLLSATSTVSGADLVLVTNYETRDWVQRLGASRVEFVPDIGISSSLLVDHSMRCRGEENCLKVLWVGRLLPRKGVLLALDALAEM